MQGISGVALIAAAVLLLLASGRACRRAGDSWLTSDAFIMSVAAPGVIISLAVGIGTLYYVTVPDEDFLGATAGLTFAAFIAGIAMMEWLHSRRPEKTAGQGANAPERAGSESHPSLNPTTPDAPRPPVTPGARDAT